MKAFYSYIALLFIYILVFSAVGRLIFTLYEWDLLASTTNSDIITAFWYGLKHDISLASYCMLLVSALTPLLLIHKKIYTSTIFVLITIAIALFGAIYISNLEVYKSWLTHIDVSVFQFFDKTFSFLKSTSILLNIALIIGWVGLSGLSIYAYNRFVHSKLHAISKTPWYFVCIYIVSGALFFIPARGGIDVAAMNSGAVYFSNTIEANHIAVNVVWNFLSSTTQTQKKSTEHICMSNEKALEIYHEYSNETGITTEYVLTTKSPNIIFIMMEGIGSDITASLGTYKEITPQFDSLCSQGILFTDVYAAGTRTDKGVVAMLSGYPAQSQKPILGFSNKVEKLPTVSKVLYNLGYNTMFFYGGNKQFCNMNSIITTGAFKQVIDIQDFDKSLRTFKWGAHDEYVYNTSLDYIQKSQKPFFAFIMTLSHHEPFTVPTNLKFKEHGTLSPIFTAAHYADSCLGAFIQHAKQQDWWKNTVIVIVSDHANTKPGNKTHAHIERYKIPMLWIGGAIKNPKTVPKTCSQMDLPATILGQLQLNSKEFVFSKNIFDSTYTGYALFAHHNGFGLATKTYYQIWDTQQQTYIAHTNTFGTDTLFCKAFWQVAIEDFLKK